MEKNNEHLDALTDIRALMERSSKFVSFTGTSAIAAGLIAIAGIFIACLYLDMGLFEQTKPIMSSPGKADQATWHIIVLVIIALLVFSFALILALILSARKARRGKIIFWDNMAKRVFMNLSVFLLTGGIFCMILVYYGIYFLIVPVMLIFYGLALVNVSKFTLNEIAQLGIIEILLGIISSLITVYPLLMWLLGFGILHLIYGAYVYLKYEKT